MSILRPTDYLTDKQRDIIDFCINNKENLFIEGPPWSGKVLTCLYGLQGIVKRNNSKLLFMVSNNAMYGYMTMALEELEIDENVEMVSKNNLFWKMAGENWVSVSLNSDYHENYDRILTKLLEEELDRRYDMVVVSEVQHYLPKEWDLIKRIAKRIVCYGDFKQAVFKNKVKKEVILGDCVHMKLNYCYEDESTKRLLCVRRHFFDDGECVKKEGECEADLTGDNGVFDMSVGYNVLDVRYEDEFKAIAQTIKKLEKEGGRVAIICPNNNRFLELSVYLESSGVEHYNYGINNELRDHDFSSSMPLFLSVFNAEGLQFDHVIIFGFDEFNYVLEMKRKEVVLKNVLYVALTRARKSTYIIRHEHTVKELKEFAMRVGEYL